MKPIAFSCGMPQCVLFSGKSAQVNQTELVHNFTEAAWFKVYTKLHIAYCEHAQEERGGTKLLNVQIG